MESVVPELCSPAAFAPARPACNRTVFFMVALPAGNRPGRASPLTNTGRDGKTAISRCGRSHVGR